MKGKVEKKSKAHIRYKLQDGTLVPGVTTVINLLAKPALIPWANRLGLAGIDVTKYVDDKAQIGTLAHAMIMESLGGEKADLSEYSAQQIDQAENSILSFFEWQKTNPLEPILIEMPLISEVYRYGGTPDIFCKMNGDYVLIDIKTGGGIYPEFAYQVAAYKMLLSEQRHEADKSICLNVGRAEDETFQIKTYDNLDREAKIFLHLLKIYQFKKEVNNG